MVTAQKIQVLQAKLLETEMQAESMPSTPPLICQTEKESSNSKFSATEQLLLQ